MNTMPCPTCGYTMTWRGFNRGWYCGNCRAVPEPAQPQTPTGDVRRAVENMINPEAIAGPSGQDLWTVEARLSRIGLPKGTHYVETIHVRAASEPGALAVGQEMLLDWIDGAALQITEE